MLNVLIFKVYISWVCSFTSPYCCFPCISTSSFSNAFVSLCSSSSFLSCRTVQRYSVSIWWALFNSCISHFSPFICLNIRADYCSAWSLLVRKSTTVFNRRIYYSWVRAGWVSCSLGITCFRCRRMGFRYFDEVFGRSFFMPELAA